MMEGDTTGFALFILASYPDCVGRERYGLGTRLDSYQLQLELTYRELIAMGLS